MKKIIVGIGLALIIFLGMIVGCSVSGARVVREIFGNTLSVGSWEYKVMQWCVNGLPFVGELEKILDKKKFVILLQNSNEIRATGGFMGSFVKIDTSARGIRYEVKDIYEPDGQLPGHVEPPYPIQEAFGQGWWKLRDSNWDPDFASAAATVAWFMKEGKEGEIDGIVAINQELIKKMIGIVGEVKPMTYDETVTENNLNQLAQKYAETNFLPGGTGKRDFLGAVGESLKFKFQEANPKVWLQIMKLVYSELKRGEMLVWFRDSQWQEEVERRSWAGRVQSSGDQDFLNIVESNLRANKANCCVSKSVEHAVDSLSLSQQIRIKWQNDNPFENPKPPVFWGGDYLNYVRIVIPASHNIKVVKVQERELRLATTDDFAKPNSLRQGISEDIFVVEKRGDLQIIGFWVKVEANSSAVAELKFQNSSTKFQELMVKRQPGEKEWRYKLSVDGKIVVDQVIVKDGEFGY